MNNSKKCTKCNIQKSFDDFYCDKQNKVTGKRNSCIECDKLYKKLIYKLL